MSFPALRTGDALLLLVLWTGAVGCHSGSVSLPARPSPSSRVSPETLDDLAMLATGGQARAPEQVVHEGPELEAFVERLLDDPSLGDTVAPRMLIGGYADFSFFPTYPLKRTRSVESAEPLYYLHKPCDPLRAEHVQPWWDGRATVSICPDSYRPERLKKGDQFCGAAPLNPLVFDFCGCGPRLMNCLPEDAPDANIYSEVRDTIAQLTRQRAPLASVFTSQATYRKRTPEFAYRRWRVANGAPASLLDDLPEWPEEGKWAARHESTPGQHAGILTTQFFFGVEDFPRPRQRAAYEMLWCLDSSSTRVDARRVLSLGTADLRSGDGWRKLASMPVCTDCHARLDYGMQFFAGFGSYSVAYSPHAAQTGRGQLFARDIDDRRGEAALTPLAFARLATQQPEFEDCMVGNVVRHVFGRTPPPPPVLSELRTAFRRSGDLHSLMRIALLAFARVDRLPDPVSLRRPTPAVTESAFSTTGAVSLSPSLKAALTADCVGCHDGKDLEPDLTQSTLPPTTLTAMLQQVAFRRMPKEGGLPEPERAQLIAQLLDAVYPVGDPDREAAADYFGERRNGLPVHRVESLLERMKRSAGTESGLNWSFLIDRSMRSDLLEYTPGLAAVVAVEAVKLCHQKGLKGAALRSCAQRISRVEELIRGPTR